MADIASWVPLPANWTPVLVFLLVVGYLLVKATYNAFFHQLASFPGPLSGRTSLVCCFSAVRSIENMGLRFPQLWRYTKTATGKIHIAIEKLHRQYGMPATLQHPIAE